MRERRVGNGAARCDRVAAAESGSGSATPSVAKAAEREGASREHWVREVAGAVLAFGLAAMAAFSGLPGLLVADASFWLGEADPMASGLWATVWGTAGALAFLYVHRLHGRARRLVSHNESLVRELAVQRDDDEQNRFLAYYDQLTRLPNREFFREQLAEAIQQASHEGCQIGVMLVDLDGFKEVNDRMGHAQGDRLLQQVARRLANCVRAVDSISRGRLEESGGMVSRVGGDEFTILLAQIRSPDEAAIVARRILNSLRVSLDLEGREVQIGASIGIAIYPSDEAEGIEGLLRNADLAMYHAKECGRNNYQFFDESLNDAAQRRTALAGELQRAFKNGEFSLAYQPIAELETGRFVALEALLRWDHPERGRLEAREFIAIAEETGLMASLGEWVLRESCRSWQSWRDAGLECLRLCINVSGLQLRSDLLPATTEKILAEFEVPGSQVELEITESAMMEDEDEASRTLEALKLQGVRIALDDFGTGYSSLSYVKRFPVDAIKIDRAFVKDVVEDSEARAITSAIVVLAHELGLSVVAEGVEDEAQLDCLNELRCDQVQGFGIAKPLEFAEVESFLRARVPSAAGGAG